MNNMNRKWFFCCCIAALISCNNSGTSPEKEKTEQPAQTAAANGTSRLEGRWVIRRAEGDMADMNLGTEYSFKGDRLSFGKDGFLNPGRTEVTDSTFSFQAEGNEYKFYYNYRFNGDTMVVTMKDGTGQVFHLVKQ